MRVEDFSYNLPDQLIATAPLPSRSDSRLLCLDSSTGEIEHKVFSMLPELLREGDLLVFNDTRVISARLYGRKESGGHIELLMERLLSENEMLAQINASKAPKACSKLFFYQDPEALTTDRAKPVAVATVLGRQNEFFHLRFDLDSLAAFLEQYGHIPLPPYIKRADIDSDRERYQTIYNKVPGAVAAPTAGLHFDEKLLGRLAEKGIDRGFLTLHVGAGTFQPVRVDNVTEHKMHSERVFVSQALCQQVEQCKALGGRVIAVGTTSVRSLESAAVDGKLFPFEGESDIFIYPSYKFGIVDAMITNFHLPRSTLLMLVSAFSSREMILGAYECAIRERYRFFSYGDAMFIHR